FRSLGTAVQNPRRSSCIASKQQVSGLDREPKRQDIVCTPIMRSQLLSGIMKRVLLLLPTTSYRNEAFIAAGKKVGVEMITAADYCHRLAPGWGLDPIRAVHFDRPGEALDVVLRSLKIGRASCRESGESAQ